MLSATEALFRESQIGYGMRSAWLPTLREGQQQFAVHHGSASDRGDKHAWRQESGWRALMMLE